MFRFVNTTGHGTIIAWTLWGPHKVDAFYWWAFELILSALALDKSFAAHCFCEVVLVYRYLNWNCMKRVFSLVKPLDQHANIDWGYLKTADRLSIYFVQWNTFSPRLFGCYFKGTLLYLLVYGLFHNCSADSIAPGSRNVLVRSFFLDLLYYYYHFNEYF